MARFGRSTPDLRTLTALGKDPRVVGPYRSLKLALDFYNKLVGDDRPEAEHLLRTRARTAFDYCLITLAETGDFVDLDYESIADIQRVHEDLLILTGVLALCLWHVGDTAGREYVRERLPGLLGGADGHRYVRATLGLQEDIGEMYWRAGTGSLGSLTHAFKRGARLLGDGGQGAAATSAEVSMAELVDAAKGKMTVDDGPSLMVLATVDHLPGLAKSGEARTGGTTGSTPRNEWAPYAGRAWPLVRVPDLAKARAELVAEFPYATGIIDSVLGDLAGRGWVLVRPILIEGAPGSGKTRLARRLGEVLGLGVQVYPCGGASDASIMPTSRQWSTGRASVMLQLLKRLQAASALLVLDEIDKVGESKSNGNLLDGILPLFTPDARTFFDSYLECPVDLSGMSYIATANDLSGLRRTHPALLDRFRCYRMPSPRREDLPVLVHGVLAEIRAERGVDEAWMPSLTVEETELVDVYWRGDSVRGVRRLVEAVLAGREALATRM